MRLDHQRLLDKISTLNNYHVCDGVLIEIEELLKQGKSYDDIWKWFKMMDEIAEEE